MRRPSACNEIGDTSCVWNGDKLTIYEPTQYVYGLKNGIAEQLGIDADQARVINAYVGGAFGSKGSIAQARFHSSVSRGESRSGSACRIR